MADFSVTQSLSSHNSSEEEDDEGVEAELQLHLETEDFQTLTTTSPVVPPNPTTTPNRSGRRSTSRAAAAAAVLSSSERKPRGRPPGSKNKPKPPVYITKETEPAMKTQLLEIPAGFDIIEMVEKFAAKHRIGIHILNGSGSVSNFTLRHPAITLSGAFNLLSLSGTYIGSSTCSSPSIPHGADAPWLAIFVGGNAGEVFGGTVVGKVVAAASVFLNVNTFPTHEFHRVDPSEFEEEVEEEEEEERVEVGGATNRGMQGGKQVSVRSVSSSAAAGGGGAAVMTAAGFAIPSEHLNWVAPSAPARPPNHHY